MATYIAKLNKSGNVIEVEIEASNQHEARKAAENLCKTTYPDRTVMGGPQPKR